MGGELTDNTAASRFELPVGDGLGFVSYRRAAGVLDLWHAEVPAAYAGRGEGSRLARAALELIRSRGERIVPRCPFIANFVARHPEFQDLLADPAAGQRS